jgi:hypothetical protein
LVRTAAVVGFALFVSACSSTSGGDAGNTGPCTADGTGIALQYGTISGLLFRHGAITAFTNDTLLNIDATTGNRTVYSSVAGIGGIGETNFFVDEPRGLFFAVAPTPRASARCTACRCYRGSTRRRRAPLLAELERLKSRLTELEARIAVPPVRRASRKALMLAACVGLVGGVAAAANGACPNGMPSCFAPDSPALASQVNNFAQLKVRHDNLTQGIGMATTPSTPPAVRLISRCSSKPAAPAPSTC